MYILIVSNDVLTKLGITSPDAFNVDDDEVPIGETNAHVFQETHEAIRGIH